MAEEKQKRNFNNQAYLIYDLFVKNRKKSEGKNKSKVRQSALKDSINVYKITGDYTPVTFISKLNRAKKINVYKHLLDMETYKLSSLVPDIRFYKVREDLYEPFYFPVASEIVTTQSLLSPGSGIGGVGIKSFNVEFTGNNPFSFDKQIECSLEIYVDNLENIFKEPPPGYAKLADLFTISKRSHVSLKDGLSQEVASEKVNRASNYEISVRMGYSVNNNSNILTQEEKTAVLNTGLSMRMTLTDHSISVAQDGTATISISYIGRLEGILSDSSLSLMRDVDDLTVMSKFLIEGESENKIGNTSKEDRQKLASRQKRETKNRMRKYFTYLASMKPDSEGDRLYSTSLSRVDIDAYRSYREVSEIEDALKKSEAESLSQRQQQIKDDYNRYFATDTNQTPDFTLTTGASTTSVSPNLGVSTDLSESILEDSLKVASDSSRSSVSAQTTRSKSIHYVYVGDMLESISYNVQKNIENAIKKLTEESGIDNAKAIESLSKSQKSLRNIKILLGEVPIRISRNEIRKVNIADIPIAMDVFTKYFMDEIEQQSKTTLSIKKFLDDLSTQLIRRALTGHGSKDAPFLATNVEIRSLSITGPSTSKLTDSKTEVDISDLPDFIKRTVPKKRDDETEYYIIYAETTESSTSGLAGDIKEDVENGIYHFHIGKNRGMLKAVNFTRFDVPYRKEALMLESVSLYDELKMPYTADISMFGNGLFLPGTMVYVNPSSIGFGDPRNKRSAAARLGLGGYYQVLKVSTSFDGTSMTTNLQTSYTSWADNDSSLRSELTPKREVKVNQSPETATNEDIEFNQQPSFEQQKSRDYETIMTSDLLTKDEKDDIVRLELSRDRAESERIAKSVEPSGTRKYITKRTDYDRNVTIKINQNNEISIARNTK